MAEKFQWEVELRGLEGVLEKLNAFRDRLRQLSQEGAGSNTSRFITQFETATDRARQRISQLRNEVKTLAQALEQPRISLTKGLAPLAGLEPTGRFATQEQQAQIRASIQDRINQLKAEEVRLTEMIANGEQQVVARKQQDQNLAEYSNRLEQERLRLIEQLESRKPGGNRIRELAAQREINLLERKRELERQIAEESARFKETVPRIGTEILNRELTLSRQIVSAREALEVAEQKVAEARAKALAAGLSEADLKSGVASEEARAQLLAREQELVKGITQAMEQRDAAALRLELRTQERASNLKDLQTIEAQGGAQAGISELLKRIQQINDEYALLTTNQQKAFRGLVGEDYEQRLTAILTKLRSFGDVDLLNADEAQDFQRTAAAAQQLIEQIEKVPKQGIPLRLSDEELFRGLGTFNRVLLGAARDIGRRFTATLQFAISGAILFGAQRLVREFFQAAIEVERSFADISTSLEFDITAPRGSVEFNKVLDDIRHRVLGIADDFNVLPSVVNEAAFQMVSRFSDVDAALIATRAQILSTRVATIDQSESLRALTAVAESYGLTLAHITDDTARQRAQAQLYATALDYATVIQQKFGVSVEDTIEGSAGLAELFRGMGFSMEETFAVIAATVRKTSVTGATAFDRIGRSFGQLTNPQVSNQLLDLAAAWDEFNLAPADFYESGRDAFIKILDQYAELPDRLQRQIDQIIGQRRETQFVSAVLNSGELVQEILGSLGDSAGSAEERVKFLLLTTQGTIEGIAAEFQSLAQNLEQLGVITPFKLILRALETMLKLANLITSEIGKLVNLLDAIRIPFTNIGLDDVLKTSVSIFTAWLGISKLVAGLKFVATVQGSGTVLNTIRSFFQPGQAGGAPGQATLPGIVGVGLVSQQLDKVSDKLKVMGSGFRTFLINPIDTLMLTASRVSRVVSGWTASITASILATLGATGAEEGLTLARLKSTIVTGLAAIRSIGWAGIFKTVATFLKGLALRLVGFAGAGLAIAGAISALSGFIKLIAGIPGFLGSEGSRERSVSKQTQAFIDEAEAAGETLTVTEARLKAVREEIDNLADDFDKAVSSMGSTAATFFAQILRSIPGSGMEVADFPGTDENLLRERARYMREELQLMLRGYIEELDKLAESDDGSEETANKLSVARRSIRGIYDALDELNPDNLKEPSYNELADVVDGLTELRDRFPELESLFDLIEETIFGFANVGSIQGILDQVADVTAQFQLQRLSPREAMAALAGAQKAAEEALKQALEATDPDPAEVKAANDAIIQIAQARLGFFQAQQARELENAALFEDNETRVRAEISVLKGLLEEAISDATIGGKETERILRLEIYARERELSQIIEDEARARLQLAVDSSRSLSDRIVALRRLRNAIIREVIYREGIIAYILGTAEYTVEEERQINDLINAEIDARQEIDTMRAKNKILNEASALDNIAAIQANIAQLKVEKEYLEKYGADEEAIQAKQIEIRNEIANLRKAEADRRESYFKLTAGAGDELAAAQAALRAARDQLETILNLGGADTKAAYDAELAIAQAEKDLVDKKRSLADLQRRNASDLTDSLEQAALDVEAAQEALNDAIGPLEKEAAQRDYTDAVNRNQKEYYDRRLDDLDFLFRTDQIGQSQYIAALRQAQSGIDRTTRQGEELWREIELQIRGLMDSAEQAFNIPTDIRLPTMFEVRRALAADALGVNYQDNRQQDINIYVSDDIDIELVVAALEGRFGSNIDIEAARLSTGGAGITIGGL